MTMTNEGLSYYASTMSYSPSLKHHTLEIKPRSMPLETRHHNLETQPLNMVLETRHHTLEIQPHSMVRNPGTIPWLKTLPPCLKAQTHSMALETSHHT